MIAGVGHHEPVKGLGILHSSVGIGTTQKQKMSQEQNKRREPAKLKYVSVVHSQTGKITRSNVERRILAHCSFTSCYGKIRQLQRARSSKTAPRGRHINDVNQRLSHLSSIIGRLHYKYFLSILKNECSAGENPQKISVHPTHRRQRQVERACRGSHAQIPASNLRHRIQKFQPLLSSS